MESKAVVLIPRSLSSELGRSGTRPAGPQERTQAAEAGPMTMKIVIQNLGKRPGAARDVLRRHNPDVLLAQEIQLPSETTGGDGGEHAYDFSAHHVSSNTGGSGTAVIVRGGGGKGCYEATNVRRVSSTARRMSFGGGGFGSQKKTTAATIVAGTKPETTSFKSAIDALSSATEATSSASTSCGASSASCCGDVATAAPVEDQALKIEMVSFHGNTGGGAGVGPILKSSKSASGLVEHVAAVLNRLDPTLPAVFAGDFGTRSQAQLDAVTDALEWAGFRRALSWPRASAGRHGAAAAGSSSSSPKRPMDHAFVRGVKVIDAAVIGGGSSSPPSAVLEIEVGEEAHQVTDEERREVAQSEHSSRPLTQC